MKIDISEIPFSRAGSFFALSYDTKTKRFLLRDIHGGDESPSELFQLTFHQSDGEVLYNAEQLSFDASETLLTVSDRSHPSRKVEVLFPTADSLHIRATDMSVALDAVKVRYDSLNQMGDGEYEYISYKKETKYRLSFLDATHAVVDAPWSSVGNEYIRIALGNLGELYVQNYKVTATKNDIRPFDEAKAQIEKEYQDWLAGMPTVSAANQSGKEMAAYLLWANMVRADGLLTETITYMSKNWMQNIWSWDNCFNAIFLAEKHPQLAYNQLKVFMDHQDASGAYPDFINDKYISFNCVKPPIHAWAYKTMMSKNAYFHQTDRLSRAYDSFVRNTQFWLNERLSEKDGLPYYTHGNDSGWDNASVFQKGLPVTSPDLTAYLIQQMDILAEFALILDKKEEAETWRNLADSLLGKFMSAFYDGHQLVAHETITGEKIAAKTSVILFLPIVIADRFDEGIKNELIQQLLERFEGPYGIATEEPSSPFFTPDGYWLGPIWAPETYIFVDALMRAGYTKDALRIAEKFCKVTQIGGMAENFDPVTGNGNDDLAFAWTSSVFLLLAEMVFEKGVQ